MAGPYQHVFDSWDREHASTLRVIAAVPARRWKWRPHRRSMSAGELCRHFTGSEWWFCAEALGIAGIGPSPAPKDRPPPSPAALQRIARRSHARLARAVRRKGTRWLRGIATFHGMRLARHRVIDLMVRHEIHHRGQLSVYVRLCGGKVPSVYGPSADERS